MKAIVNTQYGSPEVLHLTEVPRPVPLENQVLIQIKAASVNAADWHLLKADPPLVRLMFGLFSPRFSILGADVAGVVKAVGAQVTKFRPGDEVFGDLSNSGWGGFAEYVVANENAIVLKPKNISFLEAAASGMAAVTALLALRTYDQSLKGKKVLVNGASGGVGTFALQLAKALGAKVTAVCSTKNLKLARSLGADYMIDYTTQDFTKSGQQYDLIIGANGYHSIFEYRRCLTPTGRYVMTGGAGKQMAEAIFLGPLLSLFSGKKLGNLMATPSLACLTEISSLLAKGKIKPVIDKRFALKDVAKAISYVETGHARGKVVIEVGKK
jgi:NADPH:quinone reductase-like Zn-dependent oxidoreductase